MKFKLIYFLISLLLSAGSCFFRRKFNKVKDRARDYYRKNFVKDKSWHFLGYDPSEYPGTDLHHRQDNEKKWNLYYECLSEQERTLGAHGAPVPEAVLGFEGGYVRFDCKLCLNPHEQEKLESVEWYYGERNKPFLELVLFNEHIMLSPESKTLHIYNVKEEHSGQYVCILGDSVTVPYYLTVVSGSTSMREVHSAKSKHGPYEKAPELIPNHDISLDTEWGDWSGCSRCGKVGRKHRTGYCVVLYEPNESKTRTKHNSFAQSIKHALFNESYHMGSKPKQEKGSKNGTVGKVEMDLLKVFAFGIPCRSHILPLSIKNLPNVTKRQDEIMIGYCKEPCKNAEVFQAKDKNGKVIETANNSAGIYSMLQGPPPVTPAVERRSQYERLGVKVIIICPGNLNSDAPILWQIDSKNVVPELIARESKERITVTLLDRIAIAKSKVSDSKLYSCWQNNELAGTVHLVVEKRVRLGFNHHIMLLGMVAILSTFIFVFMKAFAGRKYAKRAL